MDLEPFIAKPVNPGEPVTSQGWNEIVNGLANVVAFLQATAGTSVHVVISNTDARLAESRVVAIGANGDVTEAARPVGISKEFTLRGLAPGPYTIRSESPGFAPAEANVTLPVEAPVTLSMAKAAPFMPDVFGQELLTALAALKTSNIVVSRIVDITGREVAPANPGAEFGSTIVLAQLPSTGEPGCAGQHGTARRERFARGRGGRRDAVAGRTDARRVAYRARGAWARARQGDDADQQATKGAIHGHRTA